MLFSFFFDFHCVEKGFLTIVYWMVVQSMYQLAASRTTDVQLEGQGGQSSLGFGRSVNPIQTRVGRFCPSHYCQPPRIQKAIDTTGLQRRTFSFYTTMDTFQVFCQRELVRVRCTIFLYARTEAHAAVGCFSPGLLRVQLCKVQVFQGGRKIHTLDNHSKNDGQNFFFHVVKVEKKENNSFHAIFWPLELLGQISFNTFECKFQK